MEKIPKRELGALLLPKLEKISLESLLEKEKEEN